VFGPPTPRLQPADGTNAEGRRGRKLAARRIAVVSTLRYPHSSRHDRRASRGRGE
jgi:hypothetical protein